MRRRLNDLERAAERADQGVRDKRAAMVQAWRAEFGYSLPIEEVISLSRELHAGNPDARAAWETISVEETAYLRARADEWRVASRDS